MSESFDLGGMIAHDQWNDPKLENRKQRMTSIGFTPSLFLSDDWRIHGEINYSHYRFGRFAYDHDSIEISEKEAIKKLNFTDVGVQLYNTLYSSSPLQYELGLNYSRVSDNFATRETRFLSRIALSKKPECTMDLGNSFADGLRSFKRQH